MRYMGIDYGTKRVGVALSDATGTMAFPYSVFTNDDTLLDNLLELITEREVGAVVLGHSLDQHSSPNAVQSGIDDLLQELTIHCGLPVHLQPEQYTTQAAIRIQGRGDKTDASAAALILDSFLQIHTDS